MKLTFRIWILIIFLLAAFLWIFVSFSGGLNLQVLEKGVMIKSLEKNSTEMNAGLASGMIITQINSKPVNNIEDYLRITSEIFSNNSGEQKIIINTRESQFVFVKTGPLDIIVGKIPATKIKTGLDLSGGARALVKPENITLTAEQTGELIAVMSARFNIYGLKDITIKSVTDLQGNSYVLIEIAGATPADLQDLVSSQGKFEGKIGNITVFTGGSDIAHVERAGQQAGIEGCYPNQNGGEFCKFRFPISLTEAAAKRQADATANLGTSTEDPDYLSQKLDLYIDGSLMDSLLIAKDLKGRVTTEISIQGSGTGATRQEAINDALMSMKKLQTILITGSLPYKLQIVKLDTISPMLGKEFAKNLFILAIVVFIIISAMLFIKYRKIKITSAVILTLFSEAFITLGIAALINWNLDAPSIAGIIAGMGTGVNDQIVIIDESESGANVSLKERIKRAFFIIIGAFFTIFAAMLPLFWAGAGMLKGFALTTLLSVSIGIIITRPAFADIIRKIKGE